MTGTKAQSLSARPTGTAEGITPARVRFIVALVVVVLGSVSVLAAFAAEPVGSITYVVSLLGASVVLLLVAKERGPQARAWCLVGVGVTLWMLGGLLTTLQQEAHVTAIPDLLVSIAYAAGYLPVLVGFADMADPRLHTRRVSSIVDGVILFLSLYAVIWLLVVEPVAYDSSYGFVDRALQSLYPAGDLAVLMLAVRVATSGTVRRRVGVLLIVGSILNVGADVGLLAAYLVNPDGSYPVTDLVYLVGLGSLAVAGVVALLPGPPAVPAGVKTGTRLPIAVAISTMLPAILLAGIVWFTDRQVSLAPVAVWLFLAALAAVLRNVAGMRELERAHQHALWLASHDFETHMLRRVAFLHEVSEGSLRDRTGTVIVIEVGGLDDLADRRGHDLVDGVVDIVSARLTAGAGEGAVLARLAHGQFAVFVRSITLGRGRQIAAQLQGSLLEPVVVNDDSVRLEVAIGVAQADGAVIDVLAGVRRATDAMRHARRAGPGRLMVDADLTGAVLSTSAQSGATIRPDARA